MKSVRLPSGSTYFAHEHNALRSDAAGAAFLHVHQQLGALALGTTPTNNQTVTLDINGTNVVLTAVTSIGATAGNVLIGGSAAAFVANVITLLQNPTVTTATGVALSSANAILVQYLGWALPSGGTTITPFSLNTSTYSPLTSFSASTTVTSGTWTAQTMKLYVQPGTYYVGTTRILFLGGSTPTITAPSSHPRIDLVTADSSGTIALVTGTENASPVAPSYPVNKVVIAEIYNVVGETALYDNDNQQSGQGYVLNDVRSFLTDAGYISSASQIAAGIVIFDPGSDAQGDVLYYNGAGVWARLPAGTSGGILTTNGAGANPSWGAAGFNAAKTGVAAMNQSSGTQTIAHGLGKVPALVKFTASYGTTSQIQFTAGAYDGTNSSCMYSNSSTNVGHSTAFSIYNFGGSGGNFITGVVTVDATNITIVWSQTGGGGTGSWMVWEAFG
jgi:hypothetical protein